MRSFFLIILFYSFSAFAGPVISFYNSNVHISHLELKQPLVIKKLSFLSDSQSQELFPKSNLLPLSAESSQILFANQNSSALLVLKFDKNSLQLSVLPLKGSPQKIMLDFNLDPHEFVTGLTEKVIDGPNPDAWKSPSEKTLNLNGERVTLEMPYPIKSPLYI